MAEKVQHKNKIYRKRTVEKVKILKRCAALHCTMRWASALSGCMKNRRHPAAAAREGSCSAVSPMQRTSESRAPGVWGFLEDFLIY